MMLDVTLGGAEGQTRDLSMTGMAIRTDLAFQIGMKVLLAVTTPSHGKLEVHVVVRRTIDEPGFKGVGVEFVDVSPATAAKLHAILSPSDSGVVFGEPDDPELH